MNRLLRRMRGAVGNALVWAVGWATAAVALLGAFLLAGWGAVPITTPWVLLGVAALNAATSGFVTGLMFSVYLSLTHSDGSLLGLSVGRSALAGGAIAASLPLLMSGAWMVLSGAAIPLGVYLYGAVAPCIFGAVTAGGTVFAVRREALRDSTSAAEELARGQEEVRALLREPKRT